MPVIAIATPAATFAQERGRPGTTSMYDDADREDRDRADSGSTGSRSPPSSRAAAPRTAAVAGRPARAPAGDAPAMPREINQITRWRQRRYHAVASTSSTPSAAKPTREPDRVGLACQRVEPPRSDRDDGVGDHGVEPVERRGIHAEPETSGDDHDQQQDQPGPARGPDLLGQRRGGARRPDDVGSLPHASRATDERPRHADPRFPPRGSSHDHRAAAPARLPTNPGRPATVGSSAGRVQPRTRKTDTPSFR